MQPAPQPRRKELTRWQWKVIVPLIGVLLLGVMAFQAIVHALDIEKGHWIVIVAVAGAVTICFVILSALLILIEQPLEDLKNTIARVSEGDFKARVKFSNRKDDVGQLGEQFNDMVRQLEENRDVIERLHVREMARAEHLASLGELAAGLAHEIRNPLAGIASVVDVMGRELPQDSSIRAVMPEVQLEITHIQAILNDLLAYARPRAPSFHATDLNATVEQAAFLAREQVRTKPIDITFGPCPDLPPVVHDPVQIHQVILNLLLNGIQALPEKGSVCAKVRREGHWAVICVTDTGAGIAQDSLQKIFRPFFTTRKEGTGLGLPMAKGIVDSHGGHIEVASSLGTGTQFDVWLPIERSAQDTKDN
jgi:two-component system NtrC family sensor kinase